MNNNYSQDETYCIWPYNNMITNEIGRYAEFSFADWMEFRWEKLNLTESLLVISEREYCPETVSHICDC